MQGHQTLVIKGMVCSRCIAVLRSSLEALPVAVEHVSLGKVTISGLQGSSFQDLEKALRSHDFEIVESREKRLVAEIKKIIAETTESYNLTTAKIKFSSFLAEKLNMSYDSLSSVFSKEEGITIASYIVLKRVARIKQYLACTDISLTDIAYLTGYSSVFHLSRQFKEVTGINPSDYRQSNVKRNSAVC